MITNSSVFEPAIKPLVMVKAAKLAKGREEELLIPKLIPLRRISTPSLSDAQRPLICERLAKVEPLTQITDLHV